MAENILYLTGGQQRKNADKLEEWNAFQTARLLAVNTDTLKVEKAVDYKGPDNRVPDFPSHVFKAAHRKGDTLYLCTQTEVLLFDIKKQAITRSISHPWMNDVHHVLPDATGDHVYVANTGLDQILKLTISGQIAGEWNSCEIPTWDRFDRDTDYRRIESTKPHTAHPNFLFDVNGSIFVSRFQQKDAIALETAQPVFNIAHNYIHDGVPYNGRIYFTTVDGRICIFEQDGTPLRTVDLNEIDRDERSLGWCRGIYPVSDDLAWIGFSRLRHSKFKENLSWIKHGFKKVGNYNTLPTRIVLYDMKEMKKREEVDLEPHGLNAIFSIV